MLRIGICDDLADARLVLRGQLKRALEALGQEGGFWEFSSGETLLQWYKNHAGELDLIFLDLEMRRLDGMETARRLRAGDEGLQLVFVTGHEEQVFEGYSVDRLEGGEVVLRGEIRLPVSRSCRSAALLALTRAELGEE